MDSITQPDWRKLRDRAEEIFLRPGRLYSWKEIVNGACVSREDGALTTMWAVDHSTWRGFRKIDQDESRGAKEVYHAFFCESISTAVIKECEDIDRLKDSIHKQILSALRCAIQPDYVESYNRIRKPVDLYIEHLVSMADDFSKVDRRRLIPHLRVPIDNQIIRTGIFPPELLRTHGIDKRTTFGQIRTQTAYDALQGFLACKANELRDQIGKPFYPIYFDLLWNSRYRNTWATNLFESNPEKGKRCCQ